MLWLMTAAALAGPDGALGVTAGVSSADQTVDVSGRLHWASGWQLGLRTQAARVTEGFVDGYAVDGARVLGTIGLTVPLVKLDGVRIDLEVDAGVQGLQPNAGERVEDLGLGVIADVSPMVTLPVGEAAVVRLGWIHVFHQQVSPSVALDAQGALLRAESVVALSPDLQLTVGGSTGGVFGFNGDGGKYLIGARAGVRWVPGAARTWKNF